MGTAYKIRCGHCGTQFDHFSGAYCNAGQPCVACGEHLETEMPIRCPACLHKLNTSQEAFNAQVEVVYTWD